MNNLKYWLLVVMIMAVSFGPVLEIHWSFRSPSFIGLLSFQSAHDRTAGSCSMIRLLGKSSISVELKNSVLNCLSKCLQQTFEN